MKISNKPFAKEKIKALREELMKQWNLDEDEAACFVFSDAMANSAYDPNRDPIKLMKRNGSLRDVSVAADQLSISALSDKVIRHFLFYPKSLRQS